MTDLKIECPHCHKSFKLNETLAAPLVEETRKKFQRDFEEKEESLDERRKAFLDEQKALDKTRKEVDREKNALAKEREKIDDQVAEQVAEQRALIATEEAKKAKAKFDEKMAARDEEQAELVDQLKEKDAKLAEARKQEAEFRRKQRDLDDKLKAADVEIEKRLAEAIAPEREKAKKAAEDEQRLRLAERDKKITDLQTQLQDAIRRSEQGSQQLQGEVQELDLERRLREAFSRDTIDPVPKGQHGGDTVHRVHSLQGQVCGTILWESKRTKNWAAGWPDKLKQDQRAAKADIAVIVTHAMPCGLDTFGQVEGVWVTTPGLAIALAAVLRHALTEAALARRATEGQQDKMAVLYQYLTGSQFRQRVEAIQEAFTAMQADLTGERAIYERQWAKRQKQIDRVMASTVGMWGELQGIAGASLQQIEGLEMKALDTSSSPPSS